MANYLRPHGLKHARLPYIPDSQSLLKFMSIELVMPLNDVYSQNISKIKHNLISYSNHAIHQILSSVQLLIHFRHL